MIFVNSSISYFFNLSGEGNIVTLIISLLSSSVHNEA